MTETWSHDDAVLVRVRALLAKAESTTFPAEAEALTAKAQALITKHAIDRAGLEAAPSGAGEGPLLREVEVGRPYASARAALLAAVATTNRCRVVWSRREGTATLVGHRADLDIVELLFMSLLTQATRELLAQPPPAPVGGRSRTRSFRQAFLVSYALRVAERLAAADDEATAQADAARRARALPVLAAAERDVDTTVRRSFGPLRAGRVQASHAGGWGAGRDAAERAMLDVGRQIHS